MNTLSDTQRRAGELDPAFADAGRFALPDSTGSIRSIVADGQGAFILAAWEARQCALYRMFSDGTQDFQFGQNGVSRWSFAPGIDSIPQQLIMQGDGKIIVIGQAGGQTAFTRFNRGGSPDLVFGNKFVPEWSSDLSPPGCLQADGKILLLLNKYIGTVYEARLYRFLSSGDSDLGFGTQGFVPINAKYQEFYGVTVLSTEDEKILVCGNSRVDNFTVAMEVTRLFLDGSVDSSFGQSGYWNSKSGLSFQCMKVDQDSIVCSGVGSSSTLKNVAYIAKLTRDGDYAPDFNNGQIVAVEVPQDISGYAVVCKSVVCSRTKVSLLVVMRARKLILSCYAFYRMGVLMLTLGPRE